MGLLGTAGASQGWWECFAESGWDPARELLPKEQLCLGGLPVVLPREETRTMEYEVLGEPAVWAGKTLKEWQPIVQKRKSARDEDWLAHSQIKICALFPRSVLSPFPAHKVIKGYHGGPLGVMERTIAQDLILNPRITSQFAMWHWTSQLPPSASVLSSNWITKVSTTIYTENEVEPLPHTIYTF